MRILLDENVPYAAKGALVLLGHQVDHVTETALRGLDNGRLIQKADGHYDLFITNDKDFMVQKSLRPAQAMGIILLRLGTTRAKEEIEAVERLFREKQPAELVGKLMIYPHA